MNKNLESALLTYSKGSKGFITEMAKYSKSSIIGMFTDLLTIDKNDLNSSTIREILTLTLSGYGSSGGKIRYNGYRIEGGGRQIDCEVKPKNIKKAEVVRQKKKLNGGGNFTDNTWKRFERHKQENPNILVSGFVDGRIIYIFEFPFRTLSFLEKLEGQLKKKFPDGDRSGYFLRSAYFGYQNFIESATLIYRANDFSDYKDCVVGTLYNEILNRKAP